jgi:Cu(I)/Ag(I) efflux system membrane fusion protein
MPKPALQLAPATATHHATGKIEQIAPDAVTISHGPIPSLKWGPMTMGFTPPAGGMPRDIAVGDMVDFEIQAGADGMFRIVAIAPAKGRNARQGPGQ